MRTKVRRAEELARVSANGTGSASVHWLKADELRIDPDTQRSLRREWVRQIAETFNEDGLGIIHVSRRKNGFYVIDGQHRVFACRLRGEGQRLLKCVVYENLTRPDEAQLFSRLNTTKSVSNYDRFKVRLNYDADAQAILKMIESVGLKLGLDGKDGYLAATDACEQVYCGSLFRAKETTPWALARSLRTLTGAWGMNRDAVSSVLIRGAGGVHLRYGDDIDQDRLIRQLALFDGGPIAVLSRAKIRREMTSTTLWRSVAEVMVDIYNKGLRKSPLPPFVR